MPYPLNGKLRVKFRVTETKREKLTTTILRVKKEFCTHSKRHKISCTPRHMFGRVSCIKPMHAKNKIRKLGCFIGTVSEKIY